MIEKKEELNNGRVINGVRFGIVYRLFVCLFKE